MIDLIKDLARPAVLKMAAYRSARSLTLEGKVFLDANESPWLPLCLPDSRVNRYPEPQPRILVSLLSSLYGVAPEAILVGRGADEAIDALVRAFCEAEKDGILICPPTYGMYEVAANLQGASVTKVFQKAETGFSVDAREVLAAWKPGIKLVFLCSPNNPTGNPIPHETVSAICRELAGRAIIVLDEAYIEFAEQKSMAARLSDFPNLVVLRTLSKAWALAGARCGAALGHPDLIALLQKVRAPYPLSTPSTSVVLRALTEEGLAECAARVSRLKAERSRVGKALLAMAGVETIYPSEANFILVRFRASAPVLDACRSEGIIVRDRAGEPGLNQCIRITIGSESENDLLLDAIARSLGTRSSPC